MTKLCCIPRTLVIKPESAPAGSRRLVVEAEKVWPGGEAKLTVGFLDNPAQELRHRILSHLNAWNKTGNIEFTETKEASDAQVRINREPMTDPDWDGYWSFLGTDILHFQGPAGQTMNLQEFTMETPDSEFFRVVRHEAGHTLGFPHEHMRKELIEKIDQDKAFSYFKRTSGWEEDDVIQQVLTPLNEDDIIASPIADIHSIMAYQIPGDITIDGNPIPGGDDISDEDYAFCALIYPKT